MCTQDIQVSTNTHGQHTNTPVWLVWLGKVVHVVPGEGVESTCRGPPTCNTARSGCTSVKHCVSRLEYQGCLKGHMTLTLGSTQFHNALQDSTHTLLSARTTPPMEPSTPLPDTQLLQLHVAHLWQPLDAIPTYVSTRHCQAPHVGAEHCCGLLLEGLPGHFCVACPVAGVASSTWGS